MMGKAAGRMAVVASPIHSTHTEETIILFPQVYIAVGALSRTLRWGGGGEIRNQDQYL
jgi:hypothetical protein